MHQTEISPDGAVDPAGAWPTKTIPKTIKIVEIKGVGIYRHMDFSGGFPLYIETFLYYFDYIVNG